MKYHPNEYIFEDFTFSALTNTLILQHSSGPVESESRLDIQPQSIELNWGAFTHASTMLRFPTVEVQYKEQALVLSCGCQAPKDKLCEHQTQVMFALKNREELRVFFDDKLRHEKLKSLAMDYGLENEANLDDYFQLAYVNRSLEIKPKLPELFAWNEATNRYLEANLLPAQGLQLPQTIGQDGNTKLIVVIGQHKFYNHLYIELLEAQAAQGGKIKNPLKPIPPLDLIWSTEKSEELKFYSAISKFQNNYSAAKSQSDMEGLKALVKNPLNLPVYYHNAQVSSNITASSVVPIQLKNLKVDLRLSVHQRDNFYAISGQLFVEGKSYELQSLRVKYQYFIFLEECLYLIEEADFLRVIDFFKHNNHTILIHHSKFEEFQQHILSRLENKIRVTYTYLKPATRLQLQQNGFNQALEQLIYLSDSENYVLITPVMKYGDIEIPILSRKQIYATDASGKAFLVERDEESEVRFTASILNQHPHFQDQLNGESFYLHKQRFLDEDWFLEVFDEWHKQGITILGFNKLKNNPLNPNKAKVAVVVSSGVDWFDTRVDVYYGKQKVSLKYLHKAIRNKSKFVQLGDGTQGILPQEWMDKFAKYFKAGEVVGESLRTPKINFSSINELYEAEVLTQEVKEQIAFYQEKIANFDSIRSVEVPADLQTTLREYQKQGLSWLNFLDDFNFGGCLADDMGLGKTIQVIAFILSQRKKNRPHANLVVVPTSLIFNWEAEVAKFAPSINMLTIYGANRLKDQHTFDEYEIILTSYGTLMSDIRFMKEYRFNYIFLDESQAIKNPESQRFKAVRLLQSRNKIVLTGTPIENNTMDIYGQLAFACPGLLGSKQHFKDHYSMPIDKFKDKKRAAELQKKIKPFILRRTKDQVATELPDKTEMVVYCEMGPEQRKIYNAYAKEFRDFLLSKPEDELSKHSMHVLKALTQLRQICDSPALLNNEQFYGDASAKIDALMEQIESKAYHHKILVFSQFVSMLDLIKKELQTREIPFEYLSGQTRNRAAKVEQFQNNAAVRVFLISLKAGGTGLNLTEADYVYIVDPWWNPAVENQAIDRCYRIGQKKNVVAVRLICPDTIEEKIMQMQQTKQALVKDLIKTGSSVINSFSKDELINLFG